MTDGGLIRVSDSQTPAVTSTKQFTVVVYSPISVTTAALSNGTFGTAYSKILTATGGNGSYNWSISSGSLPAGLSLDSASGAISGIPSDVGSFAFTAQVADTENPPATASQSYSFNITNGIAENPTVVCGENSPLLAIGSATNAVTGILAHEQKLFATRGAAAFDTAIELFYRSLPAYNGPLGLGWTHSYNIFLTVNSDGSIVLQDGSGSKSFYTKSGSSYVPPPGNFSTLVKNGDGSYVIRYRDGNSYNFASTGKIISIIDRFTNTISFAYDTNGDLTGITDPAKRTTSIIYDQTTTPHRIRFITDPNGKTYDFDYQGNSLYRVTNPVADPAISQERGYWEYQYYPDGFLKSKRDPNNNITQYTYYADHRMWKSIDPEGITDPTGHTRVLTYDDTLRTTTLTEKDSGSWLYTYDAQTGVIKQKADPNDKVVKYYYYPNGFLKAKTEPKDSTVNLTTFFKYDSFGNILIETEPADLSIYNPRIDPETVTDPATLTSKSPPIKAARHYTYDNANYDRITSVSDERGATILTTSFAYTTENGGEVVTATTTPGNFVTMTKKYPAGTLKQIIDANEKLTTFTYYSDVGTVGLLWTTTNPAGITTTVNSYDKNGNPSDVKVTDNIGVDVPVATTMLHDNLNRLITATKHSTKATPAFPDIVTSSGYDNVGNLTSLLDAEQHQTSYRYNYNRQVTKITDATLNDTVFTYSGSGCGSCGAGVDKLIGVYDANVAKKMPLESQPHTAYQYDLLGRLEYETDPLGKKFHYTYYDNGLVKEKFDATGATPGTLLVTYLYNNRGQITDKNFTDGTYEHYTYKPNGQLETATNQNINYTYVYYDNGRLQTVTDTTHNRQISYDQFDGLGQRNQVTILKGAGADQRVISYDYDSANRPWHITSNVGIFRYDYDNLGRRWTLTYPGTNPIIATYSYDDLNQLTGITHQAEGGPVIASEAYTDFDRVGNRKARTGNTSEIFGYDELYRLLTVTSSKPESFTFDLVGNRKTGPGTTDAAYQYNAANQMTRGLRLSYGYDNAGNQRTKNVPGALDKTWTRTWDYNNRVTKEEKVKGTEKRTVSYKYDPFGRRIEKKFEQTVDDVTETETTTYVYDNEDVVMEIFTTAAGTEKTFFTHGPGIDEPLALERVLESNGSSYYYYHADGLGSITTITDSSKEVVQSYEYSSYGMATASKDFRNSYQFTGREYDWETGTYFFRNRTYDPMDGIFTSKDALGIAGGDINLYRYVSGNPINYSDPMGNVKIKDAGLSLLGIASNSFGLVLGFGLGAVPEPTMLTKVGAVAITAKSSYGLAVNAKNLYNALTDKPPYSTGGIGTDTACAVAPGNKTAKALGTVTELGLDLAAGGVARAAAKNALGPLNKNAIERVFIRDPSDLGRIAGTVQFADTLKSVTETYNDLQ